jgi:hypothetical protein
VLKLRASATADFQARWRWELSDGAEDGAGTFLADHEVRLDLETSDWQCGAYNDLSYHIAWKADPGKWHDEDEARIVGEVRAWAREHVLGNDIANVLDQPRHKYAAVQVILPPGAENLAFLPLELAAPPGIALVIETGPASPRPRGAVRSDVCVSTCPSG